METKSKEQLQKEFSGNFKRLLNSSGKTQQDIVHDLGFSRSAVSSWYSGTRMPKIPAVDKIASYFGVKRSDLIGDSNEDGSNYKIICNNSIADLNIAKIAAAIEDAMLRDPEELLELQRQYRMQKEKSIKDILRNINDLTEDDISKVYDFIIELQKQHPKKKLTAVFRPQNPNQPRKIRRHDNDENIES